MQEVNVEFHNLTAMTRTACLEREINLNFKQASFLTGKESVKSHQLFHCPNVQATKYIWQTFPEGKKLLG